MADAQGRIVVTSPVQRIVTVIQGDQVVEVRQTLSPHIQVISMGVQGPVGTVAERVLDRAAAAEAAADEAMALAEDTATDLASLTTQLRDAFTYHTGVISAQE
ncbi:hypothetical protein IOC61_00180 [Halomonas sp. KAO]|uniref:hypothetical protein n=1 Tax=Halomonas sp. KAO TaxID=2783858 RepID=UPI00189D4CD6|nr:hypothetical protein [Halomonas sp. KAO]MBF7051746.1 hypothetical protein [Halomonas sp. KAO]